MYKRVHSYPIVKIKKIENYWESYLEKSAPACPRTVVDNQTLFSWPKSGIYPICQAGETRRKHFVDFWIFIRYSIGWLWILQIIHMFRVLKAWNIVYKNSTLLRCSCVPHFKILFSNSDWGLLFTMLTVNAVLFYVEWWHRKKCRLSEVKKWYPTTPHHPPVKYLLYLAPLLTATEVS